MAISYRVQVREPRLTQQRPEESTCIPSSQTSRSLQPEGGAETMRRCRGWQVDGLRSSISALSGLVLLCGLGTARGFAPSSCFLGESTALCGRLAPLVNVARSPSRAVAPVMSDLHTRSVWKRGMRKGVRMRAAIRRSGTSRRKWGQGMWDKFTSPPTGRAHDEVTFRSGCEGRTLTIPQGQTALVFP